MANGVGIARGILHGLNVYDQMQQRALERRLLEQQTAPVDILPYLPQPVRSQFYSGAQSLPVPRELASTVYSGILRTYEPPRPDTTPIITEDVASRLGIPAALVNQPTSVLKDIGWRMPTATLTEPRPMIDLRMVADWTRAVESGNYDEFFQRWPNAQIPATALSSFSLVPQRTAGGAAALRTEDLLDQPIGEVMAEYFRTQTGATWINPNTTLRQLQSGFSNWVQNMTTLAAAPGERAATAAETRLTEARAEAQELENQLARAFAEPQRREQLRSLVLQNLQRELGIQLDQAQLERELRLTEPIIAKAVAEAELAGLESQLRQDTYNATVERVNQELNNLVLQGQINEAELSRLQQITPLLVEQYQAEIEQRRLQSRRLELENQLLEEFGQPMRRAELDAQLLANARSQVGLELDKAELDRFRQLTGPVVAKAVTEAMRSELGLAFDQETFDAAVERVNLELENLRTQNKIDEEDYQRAVQMTPLLVSEAQQRILGIALDNEMRDLENMYARQTLQSRINTAALQAQQLDVEIQRAQVALEDARRRQVMAQRLDEYEAESARLEVERLQEQVALLRQERQSLEAQQRLFNGLDPDSRDFAFEMYELEIRPYRDAGVWIPSFVDYVSNMMSATPVDWNQYVMQYDAQMRQLLGDPPTDKLAFEWLKSEWQMAYRSASNSYYAQFPQWSLDRAPEFPPIEVWYANLVSENPLSQDELVEWWNNRGLGTGAEPTAEGSGAGQDQEGLLSRWWRSLTFNAEREADAILNALGSGAVEEIETNRSVLQEAGYTNPQIDEVLRAMRQRAQNSSHNNQQLPLWDPRRYDIADTIAREIGAILNLPGDLLLAPFGGRASRDPAVAQENVSRSMLGLSILGILLGARAMGGRPPAATTPPSAGVPATRTGPTGQFRGTMTEPVVGELPPSAGAAVATQFGDDVLELLARRLLAQTNGDVTAAINMITQRQTLLNSMGVNVQRLIQFVQGAL